MHAIASNNIVTPHGTQGGVILFDEKIKEILPSPPAGFAGSITDAGDKVVMAGFVDTHVHVNEPGRTDWEGFATATKAALRGGITTLVDMPLNCLPVTTSAGALREKLAAVASKMWVDCGFWGGVTPESLWDLPELLESGVLGVKSFLIDSGIAEFPPMAETDLKKAMAILSRYQLPYLIHAELELPGAGKEITQHYDSFVKSRPRQWEDEAVRLMIKLCRQQKTPVHIVHLSSADVLPDIAAAKKEGLPLTVETCPHYLFFASERIPAGKTLFKCCPPIREEENRQHLWQGLREGIIDCIVSDHSPCIPQLKDLTGGDLEKAWGGIASLQFSPAIIWSEMQRQGFSLNQLSQLMSQRPAAIAGLSGVKGCLAAGYDADIIIWDQTQLYTVTEDLIHHRHKTTPYLGQALSGVVEKVFLRGRLVMENSAFLAKSGRTLLKGDLS